MAHYFASDFHLGLDIHQSSDEREQLICQWLLEISHDAQAIYIVGDMFDYWFEYKQSIPTLGTRALATLAQLADQGVTIHYFTGNHDMWVFNYFQDKLGFKVYKKEIDLKIYNFNIHIGHGDGLGPGDHGYKFIKKYLHILSASGSTKNPPQSRAATDEVFSQRSRKAETPAYLGKDKEWLCIYAEDQIKTKPYDYLIFGHRHLCIDMKLSNDKSRYINLGEWLQARSYLRIDEQGAEYLFFKNEPHALITEND